MVDKARYWEPRSGDPHRTSEMWLPEVSSDCLIQEPRMGGEVLHMIDRYENNFKYISYCYMEAPLLRKILKYVTPNYYLPIFTPYFFKRHLSMFTILHFFIFFSGLLSFDISIPQQYALLL